MASTAKAELGALYLNCQERIIFKLTLEHLGHPQPKIPVYCNNATAVGIANNTIKRQRLQAMEMRYFWTCEKMHKMYICLSGAPGWKTLLNQSKHHARAHHTAVRPNYLHEKKSPFEPPHAVWPSTLKGFVGTLNNGYIRNVPLPQVLWIQSASPMKSHELIAPKVGI